ncbi:hypothetical protein F4553_000794 [Allocatelliglobosispora scoriae]|uniref:Uncharacterized protein n=1 Tax=Allocatelliglobosispora scoriae TaxID=643052 RepID=A0A841BII5_9ACTN|nr:hypothetical protein [Allocatelliglobosispora scoriae]MBB5867415.1 hypothetical protein [Allocatelliglobosispora scoriae]
MLQAVETAPAADGKPYREMELETADDRRACNIDDGDINDDD